MIRLRLAPVAMGCAMLLELSVALAADPAHAAKPGKTASGSKLAPRGKAARAADAAARRAIAGDPPVDDPSLGVESPELVALREAEHELFAPAAPASESAWPSEPRILLLPHDAGPPVHASGLPPAGPSLPPPNDRTSDLSWLAHLDMPDLPIRWDDRVVRYLRFFREDPRGHAMFANLFRHSGRFQDAMRRALRRKSLPEDLVWVSMIESGFDPTARSSSGAAGLWQLMPETARIYGLSMDRWVDQRYSPELSTTAATDLLGDLHRRFGSWELALAAYNMGHAGLASVVRRYNTNDFWTLARTEGTLPWETTLYVPKILAASVVAHNLATFGFGDLTIDPPVETDQVDAPPGMSLGLAAQAVGCDSKEIEALNPELRAARTPPAGERESRYPLRVPRGKGAIVAQMLTRTRKDLPTLDRYVVRFGESLDQVAAAHMTTTQRLVDINAIAPGEAIRGGTVLLVPKVEGPLGVAGDEATPAGPKQSVVVPSDEFVYPNRQRIFYRVLAGDTLNDVATATHVSVDDLCRWNDLDASARLQEGMTLQMFVAPDADLSRVVVSKEEDVHVVAVGSDEFFASLEQGKGHKRVTVAAKTGDTIESIGKRYEVGARTMERVNRRGRTDPLKPGEPVVVYVPSYLNLPSANRVTASNNAPMPIEPMPATSLPDLSP